LRRLLALLPTLRLASISSRVPATTLLTSPSSGICVDCSDGTAGAAVVAASLRTYDTWLDGRAPLVVHVDLRGGCVVPEVAVCSGKLPGPQARRRRERGHAEPGREQRPCQRLSNETGRQEGQMATRP
jgi:hypothetical protein